MKDNLKNTITCNNEFCYAFIQIPERIIKRNESLKKFWYRLKMYNLPKIIRKIAKSIFLPTGYYLDKNGWKILGYGGQSLGLHCKYCTKNFEKRYKIKDI